ncbi:MAG: sigma-70 family RNA polymerase sigma factor [Planctomycetota bacterium]
MRLDELNTDAEGRGDQAERREQFIRLLQQAYHAILGAVLVLVPNRTDAEDAMQETCVTLWREFEKFELGTNFRSWACSVAYNVARTYVRKECRHRNTLNLPAADLRKLFHVRNAASELLELRRERLQLCLSRLSNKERLLLKQCYGENRSLTEVARLLGLSDDALYARLSRVRKRLYQCVTSSMRQSGET